MWGGEGSEVKFYSVNYAPGFKKAELQAIMPENAKMYELSQTHEPATTGVDQTALNTALFSTLGHSVEEAIGVGEIQHIIKKCSCPLCK